MEEELQQLVKECYIASPANGLSSVSVGVFCTKHCVDLSHFALVFAKHVAVEFAYGEIGYGEASCAMNCLSELHDTDLAGLPLEIYQSFDSGEYHRSSDPAAVIAWQQYTLPAIMDILRREGWLPRV